MLGVAVTAMAAATVTTLSCGDCCTEPAPQPPAPVATSLTVTPASAELAALGETVQFAAEVRDQNGQAMAAAPVTWSSSDAAVATVGSAGLVTAVSNGSATVTAMSGGAAGAAEITVEQAVAEVEVSPSGATLVSLGDTVRLVAGAADANGHPVADAEFEWATSDASVATVGAAGLVTAVSNGSATVAATSGEAAGAVEITVEQAVAGVEVSPSGATLVSLGDTVRLVAGAADANGRPVAGAEFDWSSDDASVATVDASGLVTATGNGAATVTVRSGEAAGAVEITVEQVVAGVEVSPSGATLVSLGDTVRMTAGAADANGHPVADAEFEWATSDASVATVDTGGLVTATGNGAATITASSGLASSAVQITIEQAVSAVNLQTDSVTFMVGDTLRLLATPTDANGHTVSGAAIKWSSSAPGVASVNTSGLMRGISRGQAVVTASSGAAADSATITVHDPSLVTVTRVEPMVLIEGSAATVHGWGFSPLAGENEVLVGGLPAPVLSSTATRLSITVPRADCMPPREVLLRVSTTAGRDSAAIGSTPLSEEDRNWPQFEWRHTSSGDGCMHLPGNAGGGEFLIGVTSISEDPSHLAPVTLAGRPGDGSILAARQGSAVLQAGRVAYSRYPAPLVSASGGVRPPPSAADNRPQEIPGGTEAARTSWRARHAEAMARNQALVREWGRPDWSAGPSPLAVARSSLSEGDTVTLNAGWHGGNVVEVEAVVRLVGDHTVWLEDVANPAGTFTDAELMDLDAFYSSSVKPVNDAYFGRLSDVDGNGRLLVLMTVEGNRNAIGSIGGATPCDLYPRSQCAYSNEAEIFYAFVPDPEGVAGIPRPKDFVLRWYPMLLAHEVTHLVQFSETLFMGLPRKRDWELEGGARMAEELVGYRLFGHASGQDLGYAEWSAAQWDWFHWLRGLFDFFSGGRGAPEECSWLTYLHREGNDAPCGGPYGVPLVMHRFAMDRWGHSYPGGERALLKRLTQSPLQGFASLVDVSPGWSIERILAEFYATLWLEGTAGRDTPGMTSWDIHDIVSRFDDSLWLRPYSSSSATPSVSARIRGASTMYFHWTPDGPLRPTSFKVEPADDGPVFVWAIRAR